VKIYYTYEKTLLHVFVTFWNSDILSDLRTGTLQMEVSTGYILNSNKRKVSLAGAFDTNSAK
jgi:hypothetical protein